MRDLHHLQSTIGRPDYASEYLMHWRAAFPNGTPRTPIRCYVTRLGLSLHRVTRWGIADIVESGPRW